MDWRQLMQTDQHSRTYKQKEQNGGDKEAFATIALFAPKGEKLKTQDKDHCESVGPEPGMETVLVFSRVLGRNVLVSWESDALQGVTVDGIHYSLAEIGSPQDLSTLYLKSPMSTRSWPHLKAKAVVELNAIKNMKDTNINLVPFI